MTFAYYLNYTRINIYSYLYPKNTQIYIIPYDREEQGRSQVRGTLSQQTTPNRFLLSIHRMVGGVLQTQRPLIHSNIRSIYIVVSCGYLRFGSVQGVVGIWYCFLGELIPPFNIPLTY